MSGYYFGKCNQNFRFHAAVVAQNHNEKKNNDLLEIRCSTLYILLSLYSNVKLCKIISEELEVEFNKNDEVYNDNYSVHFTKM